MIYVEDVGYVYPDGTEALTEVSFKIKKGEKAAILGENGSGKTTLLLCLDCLLYPQRGKIIIDGIEVKKKNEDKIRRKVGLVFQNPDDQVFSATVYDDVAFGLRNMGLDEDRVREKVEWSLRVLGIEKLASRNPSSLSGGQKKRVAIAGILAMEPEVILIDEPTAGLDHRGIMEVYNVLEELNEMGKTIVVSTHDVEFAESWAEKIIVLDSGKVVRVGGREVLSELEEFGMRKPIKRTIFDELGKLGISLPEMKVELSNDAKFSYGVDGVIPEIDLDLIFLRGTNNPVKVKVSEKLRDRFLRLAKKRGVVMTVQSSSN